MRSWIPLASVAGLLITGCADDRVGPGSAAEETARLAAGAPNRGRVVVANRGSGTISVIDAKTAAVVGTFDLPADPGEPTPEPMYVVHTATHDRVFVGDRANDRVAVFDARSFAVEGTVPAGRGVFHMWADPRGDQLWINNDIDKTTTVVDPSTLSVVATVPIPADLAAGKQHDVILDPQGRYAYVSFIGPGTSDHVVQFDTSTFAETGRAEVGKDPHVSLARQHDRLYVPCQGSDVVFVLDRFTMAMETTLAVPGAHGAGMSTDGRTFYTANLPGGGSDALFTIDTSDNALVGEPVDSPYPVPHNIALASNDKSLFLTHSGGASDKVSVYRMSGADPVPVLDAEVTVGLNPFGLAYLP